MRISTKTYQGSAQQGQWSQTSHEYPERSTVLRESIASLSLRIFGAEMIIGVLGLGLRVPILYVVNTYGGDLSGYLFYVIFYILFQLVNVSVLLWLILNWYSRSYVLREHDVVLRHGVFGLTERLLQYDNMEKIIVRQTLLGRVFGFGSIEIFNPLLKENVYLRNIPRPQEFAQQIQAVVPKTVADAQRIIVKQ